MDGLNPYQSALLDAAHAVVDAAQAGVVVLVVGTIIVAALLAFIAVSVGMRS